MLAKLLGRFSGRRQPEENSGIPVEAQVGFHRPPSIEEMVKMYIRQNVSQAADEDGEETFDEADDFEEEDPDVIPITHHQIVAMTEDELRGHAAAYGLELVRPQRAAADQAATGSPGAPEATPVGTSGPTS